jgi:hypothetical protein
MRNWRFVGPLLMTSCVLAFTDEAGRKCDAAHPCANGRSCIDGVCSVAAYGGGPGGGGFSNGGGSTNSAGGDGGGTEESPDASVDAGFAVLDAAVPDAAVLDAGQSDAGQKDAGSSRVLGAPCALSTQCDSTFCSDGVCCDSACNGSCDVCSAAGQCGAAPRGSSPAPACAGGYLCASGGQCDTQCSDRCDTGYRCGASKCVGKLNYYKDDFNAGLDFTAWDAFNPGSHNATNGFVTAIMPPNMTGLLILSTSRLRDFRDGWAGAQILQKPEGNSDAALFVQSNDAMQQASLYIQSDGQLRASGFDRGRVVTFGYVAAPFFPLFVRIKHKPTSFTYEYQARDAGFVQFAESDFGFNTDRDLDNKMWITIHNFRGSEATERTAKWDNVNLPK